jgi:hypothetical protein
MLVLARAPTSSGHACRWRHAETSQTDSATFVQHQLLASFVDLPLRRRQKKRSVLVLLKTSCRAFYSGSCVRGALSVTDDILASNAEKFASGE